MWRPLGLRLSRALVSHRRVETLSLLSGVSKRLKQVVLMFSSALLTNMSQGSQTKVRTQQGLKKY